MKSKHAEESLHLVKVNAVLFMNWVFGVRAYVPGSGRYPLRAVLKKSEQVGWHHAYLLRPYILLGRFFMVKEEYI